MSLIPWINRTKLTIERQCECCGHIELRATDVRVFRLIEDPTWLSLAYNCPRCSQQRFERLSKNVTPEGVFYDHELPNSLQDTRTDWDLFAVLKAAGVAVEDWSIADGYPVDLGEPKNYQPPRNPGPRIFHGEPVGFDKVDLVILRDCMETADWFIQLEIYQFERDM